MMKRTTLAICLAATAALTLTGCGGGSSSSAGATPTLGSYTPGKVVGPAARSAAAEASEASAASVQAANSAALASGSASAAASSASAAASEAAHPSFNTSQLEGLIAQPCSNPAGTVALPSDASTTPSAFTQPLAKGLICTSGMWTVVADPRDSCDDLYLPPNAPFVTPDQKKLNCVDNALWLDGQLNTGPLDAADYRVGTTTGIVSPGIYVTENVDDCYWERLDANGTVIQNNFINAAPRAQITIRASDYAVNFQGCSGWTKQ